MSSDNQMDNSVLKNIESMLKDIKTEQTEQSHHIVEIHTRQIEVTMPAIQAIKDTLYSKGGVCETVHQHTSDIETVREVELKTVHKRIDKIPVIIGWVLAGVSTGAGFVVWMMQHGGVK